MLKRKLWRMSFLCQGTYLLIATSNGGNLNHLAAPSVSYIESADSSVSDSVSGKNQRPKIHLSAPAAKYAATYIKENKEALEKVRERSKSCFPMMDSVLAKYDLPVELKYLSVIESELKANALSHVGAVGPWQLMPGTARLLGLKVSHKYDERKHFTKSTVAAAKYIRDLYCEFGDWLLVIAAYNGGPRPVYTAIRKSGSRNFWKLQYFLPAETRGHVKRYISTHYYFEGQGGITTLTKKEMDKYIAGLNELNTVNNKSIAAVPVNDHSATDTTINTSTVAGKLIAER